jgi:hypothetical protein
VGPRAVLRALKEDNVFVLPEIEAGFFGFEVCRPVSTPTALSRRNRTKQDISNYFDT